MPWPAFVDHFLAEVGMCEPLQDHGATSGFHDNGTSSGNSGGGVGAASASDLNCPFASTTVYSVVGWSRYAPMLRPWLAAFRGQASSGHGNSTWSVSRGISSNTNSSEGGGRRVSSVKGGGGVLVLYLDDLDGRGGAESQLGAVRALERHIGVDPFEDYRSFSKTFGGEPAHSPTYSFGNCSPPAHPFPSNLACDIQLP